MRRIIEHTSRPVRVRGEDGAEYDQEQIASVTFLDHNGAAHTLTFHPPGTNVAGDVEPAPRVVGEHVPHFAFSTPEQAVDAYERGEIA